MSNKREVKQQPHQHRSDLKGARSFGKLNARSAALEHHTVGPVHGQDRNPQTTSHVFQVHRLKWFHFFPYVFTFIVRILYVKRHPTFMDHNRCKSIVDNKYEEYLKTLHYSSQLTISCAGPTVWMIVVIVTIDIYKTSYLAFPLRGLGVNDYCTCRCVESLALLRSIQYSRPEPKIELIIRLV